MQALTFGVVVGLHSLIYLEGKFPRSSDSSAVDVLHLFFSCIISFMLISGNPFSIKYLIKPFLMQVLFLVLRFFSQIALNRVVAARS